MALRGAFDPLPILDIAPFDDPGRAFAVLLCGDDASADLAQYRHRAQIEHLGCLGQRDLATFGPRAVLVDRDVVCVAEAAYTRLSPPVQAVRAGGFNWSSQHLAGGSCDGGSEAAFGSC